jgi:hypothetical protein
MDVGECKKGIGKFSVALIAGKEPSKSAWMVRCLEELISYNSIAWLLDNTHLDKAFVKSYEVLYIRNRTE